jgi:hypothetical protein
MVNNGIIVFVMFVFNVWQKNEKWKEKKNQFNSHPNETPKNTSTASAATTDTMLLLFLSGCLHPVVVVRHRAQVVPGGIDRRRRLVVRSGVADLRRGERKD